MINNISLYFLTALSFLVACSPGKQKNGASQLPYYQEATFTPQWFRNSKAVPEGFHKIPGFSLVNQAGNTITREQLNGNILVVDFFFTSCPGICPKMTDNMKTVQETFLDDPELVILSHSVTPDYDSIPVLQAYAEEKEIISGKWHLLTGSREQIYDLGRNYYFIEEDLGLQKEPGSFIHTENFVLVDKNGYLRGIYNGLNKTSVNQLVTDIRLLKQEG